MQVGYGMSAKNAAAFFLVPWFESRTCSFCYFESIREDGDFMKKKNIFTGLFTMSMIASTKIVTVSVCSPGATWNKWIVDKKLMMSR